MLIIRHHNVVVDALDNIESRFLLQKYCKKLSIPLVHGAICGWFGQVCTIMPGDDTLNPSSIMVTFISEFILLTLTLAYFDLLYLKFLSVERICLFKLLSSNISISTTVK